MDQRLSKEKLAITIQLFPPLHNETAEHERKSDQTVLIAGYIKKLM
jgi:hypothetical protein